MEYLERAVRYAEARGDEALFAEIYGMLRQGGSVEDSVWEALRYIYNAYVADMLLDFQ